MVGVQKVMERYFVLSWGDQKDIDRYLYFDGVNKKISIDIFFIKAYSKRYRSISFLVWGGQKDIDRYLFVYPIEIKISIDIFLIAP